MVGAGVTIAREVVTLAGMSTHKPIDRRSFLAASAAVAVAGPASMARAGRQPGTSSEGDGHRGPCVISSGNGLPAVNRAYELMWNGVDPADAVVAGVQIVEDDPSDTSVGYGGLPNEDGVVQLDASVMHGPTHKAGAVAAIENIKNPAAVALRVLKHTDHVLIVGEGARRFALMHGFKEENLLTEGARRWWLERKRRLNPNDDWLDPDQVDPRGDEAPNALANEPIPFSYGTIHCSAVNRASDLGACTTTSGLSWKIPGRVGDSPIIGAGMYCDNEVGSAGATGRGEAVIQNCGAFLAVQHMADGMTPTEACLGVLKRIADRTRQKRLLDERGRPNFGVTMYAVRKDGAFGSATMWRGGSFAVHDSEGGRLLKCAYLYEREASGR